MAGTHSYKSNKITGCFAIVRFLDGKCSVSTRRRRAPSTASRRTSSRSRRTGSASDRVCQPRGRPRDTRWRTHARLLSEPTSTGSGDVSVRRPIRAVGGRRRRLGGHRRRVLPPDRGRGPRRGARAPQRRQARDARRRAQRRPRRPHRVAGDRPRGTRRRGGAVRRRRRDSTSGCSSTTPAPTR